MKRVFKNRLSKETRKKLDEYAKKLLEEQLKMERLVSHNLDYNFLQELIDRVEGDIVIDVRLNDGTTLSIHKVNKPQQTSAIGRIK